MQFHMESISLLTMDMLMKWPLLAPQIPMSPLPLCEFKHCVCSCHETFNAQLKNSKCLAECFQHGTDKHKIVFEAVGVICQYQMENGSPLFDV